MGLRFEWDANKAIQNRRKHRVSFEEATTIFGDPRSITIRDEQHSSVAEERYLTLGRSTVMRILVVGHREDDDRIRIITARLATARERKQYEEGN